MEIRGSAEDKQLNLILHFTLVISL